METRPFVPWDMMNSFMIDVFVKYGVPKEDARICADVLLESDRRGIESHGCNRFKPIYLDRIDKGTLLPVTKIDIVKETPTTVVMDANNGMGMVASYHMMEKLIEKAKTYGMAGGTIFNSTHYGIAGYWTTMAEKAGMIGISGTNARPSVAPTFGVEPMMGTNPLTFTMPTDEDFPFNFDCATSIVQNGKIEFYERSGKDENGNNRMYRLGHFFFVINPEFFMGLDTFEHTAGGILRGLRDSEKAPGAERIYTAGEKEWLAWQERKDKGVPVGESIQKELTGLRDRFGLDYKFPFES